MTRVLVVHAGNMYGGVERALDTLAQAPRLTPGLLQPAFALCFDGPAADSLRRYGADVQLLGPVRLTRPDLVMRARRRFADVIARVQPEVVITPAAWAHALFAPVVVKAGLPLVMWVHDALTGTPWIERLAARHRPDLLVCNGGFSLAGAKRLFPDSAASIARCPLTFTEPSHARAHVRSQMDVGHDTAVIVNVARLSPLKGQADLLEALGRMRARERWECWIVGGAQREDEALYERELFGMVGAAGLGDRVRFLGQRDDVPDLLAAADVYCHPNRGIETFGLSLVEALYAGLPVVATDIGGPVEVVGAEFGDLVPAGNPDALARALDAAVAAAGADAHLQARRRRRALELCEPVARLHDLASALAVLTVSAAA
jgi:glycosyltransferase involved in cell wall biosynthesis